MPISYNDDIGIWNQKRIDCSIAIMKDDSFNFVTAIGSAFSNARHTFRDVQLPTEATTISECSETYPLHAFRDM